MGLMRTTSVSTVPPARRRKGFVVLQAVLLALAGGLAFLPPAQGRILIVPLGTADASRVAAWASAGGAKPVDSGPFAGSLIVEGARAALLPGALRHGALLLNTNLPGCSGSSEKPA